MVQERYYATGRRKTAVARVWISPGTGAIKVNGRPLEGYFDGDTARMVIERPFVITETIGKYDTLVTVRGGGKSAQAEAIRHGISRALLAVNENYRVPLKKAGFLTRDPRVKERKKYGLAGARKRFQYSKR
ncbi:MAG: 30S ribosomal protein S9 [Deltaproteobacteria bacterium]